MTKKEHTTITELFQVLDLLESLDMQFWLDGGWWKSHATLPPLAKQNGPLWLQYD